MIKSKYDESNDTQFIRELIDIGYAVKKSQLEASKGKEENWESVYQAKPLRGNLITPWH